MADSAAPQATFTRADIEQSIARRFEQQVLRNSLRVALRDGTVHLTCAALNAAANGVARALLQRLGRGPRPVALLLDQGAAAIVALLGVLKAGHFYVPLDPTHPETRLRSILRDLGNPLLVTSSPHLPLAERLGDACLGMLNADDLIPDTADLGVAATTPPESLAYVYYTSGSTGEPKGVMQTQRNVLHFVMASTNEMQITAGDVSSMMSYFGAAAGVSDIFGALLNGAALHPYDLRTTGLAPLPDWLDARAITLFHCVPTVLRHLDGELAPGRRFARVRVVRLGGEPVTRRDVEIFRRHFTSDCRLGVSYGSTERNVIRRFWIGAETVFAGHVAPIGYETADVAAYVADTDLRPVPEGEAGQIVVRSAYLSPGYWKRPELTAQVFRHAPGSSTERLYLTGDLGRMAPGDCLYHLGRVDAQVKVRGHRVELMEIEAALLSLPVVTEAVVTATYGEEGTRLVAYVVPAHGTPLHPQALRTALAESLPVHMLPTTFVPLEAMPLLPEGKVNRLALPEAPLARGQGSARSPRNHAEARLLAIWRDVLENQDLGPEDDFFDLGGDSLQVVALMTKIRHAFGVDLPPNTLLQHSTAAALAALIPGGGLEMVPALSDEPPAGPESDRLSFWFPGGLAEKQGLLRCAMLERALGPEWPCSVLDVRRLVDSLPQGAGLPDLAAECVKVVLSQQPRGPYLLGGLCAGGLIAYETACQLLETGAEVAALVLRDTLYPGTSLAARASDRGWRRVRETLAEARALGRGQRLPHLLRNAATMLQQVADRFEPTGQARRRYRAMLRAYRPGPLAGALTMVVSDSWGKAEPFLGWSAAAVGSLEIRRVPGDHQTWDQTQVRLTADHICECFAKALGRPQSTPR